MDDTKIYQSHVKGVGCSVSGCKFHSASDNCVAKHIEVSNERAATKGETFCSTFSPGTSCAGNIY